MAQQKAVNDLRTSVQAEHASLKQHVATQIDAVVHSVSAVTQQLATGEKALTDMQSLFMLQFQELKNQNKELSIMFSRKDKRTNDPQADQPDAKR